VIRHDGVPVFCLTQAVEQPLGIRPKGPCGQVGKGLGSEALAPVAGAEACFGATPAEMESSLPWQLLQERRPRPASPKAKTATGPPEGLADTSAGSSPRPWLPGSRPPSSLGLHPSSGRRRAKSPAPCSADSLWAGECWPSLVVLTAGIGSDSKHLAAQDSLAGLSTNSAHRTNGGASHESLVADEAGAASTTQAILDVVSAVQRGGPLPR